MELTPEQARQLAYIKRKEALESLNQQLRDSRDMREKQIEISSREKGSLNFLSFAIVGAIVGVSPQSLCNPLVLPGLATLLVNSLFFGYWAEWRQRNLNIKNLEGANKDFLDAARPYFDAYDQFIAKEPMDQDFWEKQQDAYIAYLERQKELSDKPRIAPATKLAIGEKYLWIFTVGLLLVGTGLLLEYCFS